MSEIDLVVALKIVALLVVGYYLGLAIIGANLGAQFWKEAEREIGGIDETTATLTTAFRIGVLVLSVLVVLGFFAFGYWWLGFAVAGAVHP